MRKTKEPKTCPYCCKEFLYSYANRDQVFCSRECKGKSMRKTKEPKTCPYCCKEFLYSYANRDQVFCSRECRQENDRKGCLGTDGYVYIGYGGKSYMQHRYVMEQHLGRKLLTSEVIHHIDGNKQNNDISNLQLVASHREHVYIHTPRKFTDTEAECLNCREMKEFCDFYKNSKGNGPRSICIRCHHAKYVARRKAKGLPVWEPEH